MQITCVNAVALREKVAIALRGRDNFFRKIWSRVVLQAVISTIANPRASALTGAAERRKRISKFFRRQPADIPRSAQK